MIENVNKIINDTNNLTNDLRFNEDLMKELNRWINNEYMNNNNKYINK